MEKTYIDGLVSVIVPVYNAEKYLADTLRSVFEQDYPDIEIEDVSRFCGKYGDMWKKYMMENYHVRYRSLMLDGKLNEIAMEVNEEAYEMIDSIEKRYFEKHKLQNSASTIEMWQVREMIKTVAEETILPDIVYKTR